MAAKKKGKPGIYVPRPRPNRLQEIRTRGVPLSQREVSIILGVDPITVSRHESGERKMSRDQMVAYAQLYKCSTAELFLAPETLTEEVAVPPKEEE